MTEIISYSEIFKWDTCHRQYYYAFDLNLRPVETSDAIDKGNKGHALLEVMYNSLREGSTKEQALAAVHATAKKMMSKPVKSGGILSALPVAVAPDYNLLNALTLVENYIQKTDHFQDAELIENRFLIPVSTLTDTAPDLDDVLIGFTPDVVFKRGNFYDIEDFKFGARMWSQYKLARYTQSKYYHIFMKRLNFNVSRSSIRFFNVANGDVKLHPFDLKEGEEEILIYELIEGIREVMAHRKYPFKSVARRTTNYTVCQFCQYAEPCSVEAQGKSAEHLFKNDYIKSNYDYNS